MTFSPFPMSSNALSVAWIACLQLHGPEIPSISHKDSPRFKAMSECRKHGRMKISYRVLPIFQTGIHREHSPPYRQTPGSTKRQIRKHRFSPKRNPLSNPTCYTQVNPDTFTFSISTYRTGFPIKYFTAFGHFNQQNFGYNTSLAPI